MYIHIYIYIYTYIYIYIFSALTTCAKNFAVGIPHGVPPENIPRGYYGWS